VDCKSVSNMIQDYLEGELSRSERARLEKHLRRCGTCSEEADRYRKVFSLLSNVTLEDAPLGFENAVMGRLGGAELGRKRVSRLRWVGLGSEPLAKKIRYPLAAAVVLFAVYFPLIVICGGIKEAGGRIAVWVSGLLVGASSAVREFGVIYRLAEVLKRDLRVLDTVFDAVAPYLWASGEDALFAGAGIVALTIVFAILYRSIRKRRLHNAPFCF
jgi:anti-sigma factor (TIGR02949 family)